MLLVERYLTFHFSFIVDYDAGVVFEIYEDAIFPSYRFPLPYDDRRHDCNERQ